MWVLRRRCCQGVGSHSPREDHRECRYVQFLRHKGLGEDNIRRAVLRHPHLLCGHVGKTLKPKVGVLEEAGFSSAEIVQLISTNAGFLHIGHLEAKIDFWRKTLGSTEWTLRVISTTGVLTSSIDKKIKPNISLLRETGLAEHRVRRIICRRPRMITFRIEKLRSLIEQVRSLGISAKSRMFEHAIYVLADNSKTTFNVKMSLLKDFGWSEEDFFSALRRNPHLIGLSEKKIREAMEFLVGEVGCEPSYVALRPVLLTYSLKKRLMPRYSVLKNLKSKGLPAGQNDYLGVIVLPEKSFMERYVLPYCEKVPGLLEAYSTAIDK